ncbi:MAG: hemerythrin domain-containing protein [Pseudomonadota bacterium]
MPAFALADRDGLPDALRVLVKEYPRETWETDPGFDELTRFWLDRHLMFRRLLEEVTKANQAVLDTNLDPQRYAATLSRYGGMLVQGLHEHHTIEDQYYFPKLSQNDSRILKGFDILDSDHHALDRYLLDFTTKANATLQGAQTTSGLVDAVGALHTATGQLANLLDRHLIDEEELVVPVILRYGAPQM